MAGFCRAAWNRFREIGLAAWAHHTEIIGAIGITAGSVENYLETNNVWHMPDRIKGILVGSLGFIVMLVGLYHSLRDFTRREHEVQVNPKDEPA